MNTVERGRKPRRKPSAARQEQTAARKAEIELAVEAIQDDAPDFMAFLARWGDRYNHNNLCRLWVQAPNATCLHKFPTWRGMGGQVRKGETAILLMQPRTGTDPERVTPDNPDGKVFFGASGWHCSTTRRRTLSATSPKRPDRTLPPIRSRRLSGYGWKPPACTRTAAETLRTSWPHGHGTRSRGTG